MDVRVTEETVGNTKRGGEKKGTKDDEIRILKNAR